MSRVLPLLALALAACNTGFDPQYRVRDLRILDIRSVAQGSNSADVLPGDTLVLSALVVNPLSRPGLTVDWLVCLPQASQAVSPCLDADYLQDPSRLAAAVGTIPGVVALDPENPATYVVPSSPGPLDAALGFVVGLAEQNSTYECRLFTELVAVAVVTAGGRQEIAYKRIPLRPPPSLLVGSGVTDRYVPNLNPTVGDVRLNPSDETNCTGGATVPPTSSPFPSGEVVLCALGGNGSAQSVNLCEPDGSTTQAAESIDWQWYVTDGDFPDDNGGVGDARGGHVKFQRPSSAFTLWTVVRDGRGGTDWASFTYPAQ